MPFIRTTDLPLWYTTSILVVIILGIANYLGLKSAIASADIDRALMLQYFDFLIIGLWFVINIIMVAYLASKGAKMHDFIPPFYFIGVHAFYIILILFNNMGYRVLSESISNVSLLTSGIEITMAGIYMLPHLRNLGKEHKEHKRKFKKER